ncbi:MAG: DUF4221 family protein [Candidatus Kapabacteria bacterium]|nr:DUF4221 family protein [Candidatus Kapabacteria bacterium]
MRLYHFFSVYIIFLFSCSSDSSNEINFEYEKTFSISISDTTDSQPNKISYYYDLKSKQEYLVNYNADFDIIELYSIKYFNLNYVIHLNFKAKGIFIHNLDSIFCISKFNDSIFLINTNSEILQSWDINEILYVPEGKYVTEYNINEQMYLIDNNLIIKIGLDGYPFEHYKAYTLLNFNIVSQQHNKLVKYPIEISKQDDPGLISKSYCESNGCIVVIFSDDPTIFKYDKIGNLISYKIIKSKYIQEFSKYDTTLGKKFSYNNKHQIMKPEFFKILYDNYNKVFYRINKHKQEFEVNGIVNDYYDCSWSISILDSNLNLIYEQLFPPKNFYFLNTFVTKEGLIISNNNPNNPNYDENYFSFSLFKLMKRIK